MTMQPLHSPRVSPSTTTLHHRAHPHTITPSHHHSPHTLTLTPSQYKLAVDLHHPLTYKSHSRTFLSCPAEPCLSPRQSASLRREKKTAGQWKQTLGCHGERARDTRWRLGVRQRLTESLDWVVESGSKGDGDLMVATVFL